MASDRLKRLKERKITLNSARLQGILTTRLPAQKNLVLRLDVSLMGVGRLRAVSFFSFESKYIESTLERGSGGYSL